MSNEYELALDNRQDLIYTKEQLMAPLLPGMEAPPHPMRLGPRAARLATARNPQIRRQRREAIDRKFPALDTCEKSSKYHLFLFF